MNAAPLPPFVCPRCRGRLAHREEAYACAACGSTYPVVLGIPDFRVEADPWLGMDDDRAKARRLDVASAGADLEATVRAYWAMTPETPPAAAERFVSNVLGAEARSAEWLEAHRDDEGDLPGGPWLDLGCGTGDLLAPACARGATVVGIDIALRWLVVARRRPVPAGRAALVCCDAAHLPFADGAFARVLAFGMLEHCADASPVLAEARRVLAPGGALHLRTTNRFSLLPEPHVNVWGVGFVPRRLADRYVRWRSRGGARYLHHRPLSPREVMRDLRRAGLRRVRVEAAGLLPSERRRLGPAIGWVAGVYDALRRTPLVGLGLRWIAPLLEARAAA